MITDDNFVTVCHLRPSPPGHTSTLAIHDGYIEVLGDIPHGSRIAFDDVNALRLIKGLEDVALPPVENIPHKRNTL